MDSTTQHLTSDVTPVLGSSNQASDIETTTSVRVAATGSTLAHTLWSSTGSILTSGQSVIDEGSTITSEITTDQAVVQEAGLAPGAIAGIVLAILFLVGTVVVVLIFFRRRRPREVHVERVWHELSVHAVPNLTKPRTQGHENESEWADGEYSDFDPDLELQPANIFRDSSAFMNSDDDSSVFTDSTQLPAMLQIDTENVVLDSKNKSFQIINNNETNMPTEIDNKNTKTDETAQANSPEPDGEENIQYDVIQKNSSLLQDVDEVDRVNTHVDDVADDESNNNECDESASHAEGTETTSIETPNDELEESEGGVYTNVEIIRRVKSVHSSSENNNENAVQIPKKALRETRVSGPKPPVPNPRDSKKKRVDSYDYPPQRALTDNQVNKFMSAELPPGYDHVDESTFIANRESRTTKDTTDDIYDVPQKRDSGNENQDDEIEQIKAETANGMYDVPPRRDRETDEDIDV